MGPKPHTDVGRCVVAAAAILLLIGWGSSLPAAERMPLRILLTNDDGFDSPGIKAVYDTLIAAGHTVTVVAPRTNQSGSGTRWTTRGVLNYKQESAGIWSVDGSPADSVLVGLKLKSIGADAPDIVISGANFGQNLGYASRSGTVGAAVTAVYMGIPAMAVSVGIDLAERDAVPIRFPSTVSAFEGAARLILQLLDQLQNAAINTGELLPEHTMLNVNYPAVGASELKGVRITQAGGLSGWQTEYEDTGPSGQLQVRLKLDPPGSQGVSDTDVELFFDGYATITALDGDWDAGTILREEVLRRLPDLNDQ